MKFAIFALLTFTLAVDRSDIAKENFKLKQLRTVLPKLKQQKTSQDPEVNPDFDKTGDPGNPSLPEAMPKCSAVIQIEAIEELKGHQDEQVHVQCTGVYQSSGSKFADRYC